MMYDELVKHLRHCGRCDDSLDCDYCEYNNTTKYTDRECSERLMLEAADAIDELSRAHGQWIEQERNALLKSIPRWIPVTERLPEDLQNVLVIDDGRVTIGHCEHYYGDEQIYVEWHDTLYYPIDPPCWMPLPEPPKEEDHA